MIYFKDPGMEDVFFEVEQLLSFLFYSLDFEHFESGDIARLSQLNDLATVVVVLGRFFRRREQPRHIYFEDLRRKYVKLSHILNDFVEVVKEEEAIASDRRKRDETKYVGMTLHYLLCLGVLPKTSVVEIGQYVDYHGPIYRVDSSLEEEMYDELVTADYHQRSHMSRSDYYVTILQSLVERVEENNRNIIW